MANKNVIAMKEAKVKELADHIKDAKLVLLVDYRGTTVEADTKLRKNIREVNGELKVIKNERFFFGQPDGENSGHDCGNLAAL